MKNLEKFGLITLDPADLKEVQGGLIIQRQVACPQYYDRIARQILREIGFGY